MSTYSMVALIILATVSLAGLILKLLLRKQRHNLEGFHGFTKYKEKEVISGEEDSFQSF